MVDSCLGCMNPFGEYAALRRFTRNLHQSPEVHVLDAGHFAAQDKPDDIARLMAAFLDRLPKPAKP
jgi:pimeloyl-ACP methyl ester carboxylesterase